MILDLFVLLVEMAVIGAAAFILFVILTTLTIKHRRIVLTSLFFIIGFILHQTGTLRDMSWMTVFSSQAGAVLLFSVMTLCLIIATLFAVKATVISNLGIDIKVKRAPCSASSFPARKFDFVKPNCKFTA